jgi:hypothetical protein
MGRRTSTRTRRLAAIVGAIGLVVTGAFLSNASGDGNGPRHTRTGTSALANSALTATGASTLVCRLGYDTETTTLVPPDDSTADNPAAGSVTFAKPCPGVVIGQLTAEMAAPNGVDFVHVDMRATCVDPMTFAAPCTVGTIVLGSPGHTFTAVGPSPLGTRTVTMVFPGLQRGKWKFEALVGGNGSARLQFRTFTATAYNGG